MQCSWHVPFICWLFGSYIFLYKLCPSAKRVNTAQKSTYMLTYACGYVHTWHFGSTYEMCPYSFPSLCHSLFSKYHSSFRGDYYIYSLNLSEFMFFLSFPFGFYRLTLKFIHSFVRAFSKPNKSGSVVSIHKSDTLPFWFWC